MSIKRFNNVLVYRLFDPEIRLHSPTMNRALAEKAHRPIASQELSTMGFVPPFGLEGEFVEVIGNGIRHIAVGKTERMLPGKVVRAEVQARIKRIEYDHNRKVYSKERNQIKDEVVLDLLPRTFLNHTRVNVLIGFPYIFIEATSAKKAEEVLSLLREALGSLPVRPVTAKVSPVVSMTDWVKTDELPMGFSLGESFQCRGTSDEAETLSGKNVTLAGQDIHGLLETGRQVNQLQLSWYPADAGPSVLFTLTETLGLKGIQWPAEFDEQISDELGEDDDAATEARATLLLLANTLKPLVRELLQALDGEELPQGLSDDEEEEQEELV